LLNPRQFRLCPIAASRKSKSGRTFADDGERFLQREASLPNCSFLEEPPD